MKIASFRPAALTILACCTVALAQTPTGSVRGVVRAASRKPLAGASVQVREPKSGKTLLRETNAVGVFQFAELAPGAYDITVNASGMKAVTVQVTVAASQITHSNIRLDRDDASAVVAIVANADTIASYTAPSQGSLAARSAQSEIRDEFVRQYTAPVVDYTQVVQMAPGMFSYSPNGPGLGDTKTFFRGFSDGQYAMTFDGIPFNDTNDPTHHSWAFFPGQFLGGANVERSPGSAATIGANNFGGSINLLSRIMEPEQRTSVDVSGGAWNTYFYGLEYESGNVGKSNLVVNAHEMKSDGYQTLNLQHRDAMSIKYQYALSNDTQLTAFTDYLDIRANTPNIKGATRAQLAQFGDNYLLQKTDPSQLNYVDYNKYHIISDFSYLAVNSNLGSGWKLDDKLYSYHYKNMQLYTVAPISATSGTDKLNSYRTTGNIFRLSQESATGTLRTGLWSEVANTNRYQTPTDPRTWVDAPLSNFHEMFTTTTLQPFVEYELNATPDLKITPGVKESSYRQDFTQFADNGKTVGNLGGAPYIKHATTYTSTLPSLDIHYMLDKRWSVYAQYALGDEIPPSSVFDVKNANVAVLPESIKSRTLQIGTVRRSESFTLSFDAYRIKFDNSYSSTTDLTGVTTYYANGSSVTQGVEGEGNVVLGGGFNLYANATAGSAKYDSNGQWLQNAPRDTESLGLYYQEADWNIGLLGKRVGRLFNDNGAVHQAIAIDPFVIPNLFVNYTLRYPASWLKQARLKLSVTNISDKHSIVAVTPFAKTSSVAAPGDVLTLLPARSVSFSVGFDF